MFKGPPAVALKKSANILIGIILALHLKQQEKNLLFEFSLLTVSTFCGQARNPKLSKLLPRGSVDSKIVLCDALLSDVLVVIGV